MTRASFYPHRPTLKKFFDLMASTEAPGGAKCTNCGSWCANGEYVCTQIDREAANVHSRKTDTEYYCYLCYARLVATTPEEAPRWQEPATYPKPKKAPDGMLICPRCGYKMKADKTLCGWCEKDRLNFI